MTDSLRFRPGDPAPETDTYYLFDRYGAPTGCSVRCEVDDPLPHVAVTGYGPLLYGFVGDEPIEEAA